MLDRRNLSSVSHQVAGHGQGNMSIGLLQVEGNDNTVLKPIHLAKKAGKCEYEFYENMVHNMTPRMMSFIPRYYGKQQVMDSNSKSVQDYLQLENLLSKFKKPCLIDIKLGYRTYDEDATTLKISQEIAKYFYQKTIGFRLSGMKIYNYESDKYDVYSRDWGRSIPPARMSKELLKFFLPTPPLSNSTNSSSSSSSSFVSNSSHNNNNNNSSSNNNNSSNQNSTEICGLDASEMNEIVQHRLDSFIGKLQDLLHVFQHEQDKYRFYASSILCVYEGDWSSGSEILRDCELRMIDFAHVFPIPDSESTEERRDQNVLFGLRSILSYLLEMRDGAVRPRSPVDVLTVAATAVSAH